MSRVPWIDGRKSVPLFVRMVSCRAALIEQIHGAKNTERDRFVSHLYQARRNTFQKCRTSFDISARLLRSSFVYPRVYVRQTSPPKNLAERESIDAVAVVDLTRRRNVVVQLSDDGHALRQVSDLFQHRRQHLPQLLDHDARVADIQQSTRPCARR